MWISYWLQALDFVQFLTQKCEASLATVWNCTAFKTCFKILSVWDKLNRDPATVSAIIAAQWQPAASYEALLLI